MIVKRAGDAVGTPARSLPRLFAVSRVQMRMLPGGARSGTVFAEVSTARGRAGAAGHFFWPSA